MSDSTQSEPVMDGAGDATDPEKLTGLVQQVDEDHGGEGAAAMADHLRDRLPETTAEAEEPGDLED